MRRLYAFLLLLAGVGVISSEVAKAQSYQMTDYVVRKIDSKDAQGLGSGANWTPLAAGTTVVPYPGTINYYQSIIGEYCTQGIQMPFNFRFLNNSLTTTNSFS